MRNAWPTPKLKLRWLAKRKPHLTNKVNNAFRRVRRELIEFLNDYKGAPDNFLKCLARYVDTDDVMTFIGLMESLIKTADTCKGDPEAFKAKIICKFMIWRIYWLSGFTIQWTNVKIGCDACHKIIHTNFLFTDKVCPRCGSIIF